MKPYYIRKELTITRDELKQLTTEVNCENFESFHVKFLIADFLDWGTFILNSLSEKNNFVIPIKYHNIIELLCDLELICFLEENPEN